MPEIDLVSDLPALREFEQQQIIGKDLLSAAKHVDLDHGGSSYDVDERIFEKGQYFRGVFPFGLVPGNNLDPFGNWEFGQFSFTDTF